MTYQVNDFMTKDPICLTESESMLEGRNTMRDHSIRHVPVVDKNGDFQGILSQKNVLSNAISTINSKGLEKLERSEKQLVIKDFIDTDVITVSKDTPLLKAAQFFQDNRHGCIVVLQNQKVIGILTSGDFVKFAIQVLEKEDE